VSEGLYELTEKGERYAVHGVWPCLSRVDRARLYLAWGGWRGVNHPGDLPLIFAEVWHDKPKEDLCERR